MVQAQFRGCPQTEGSRNLWQTFWLTLYYRYCVLYFIGDVSGVIERWDAARVGDAAILRGDRAGRGLRPAPRRTLADAQFAGVNNLWCGKVQVRARLLNIDMRLCHHAKKVKPNNAKIELKQANLSTFWRKIWINPIWMANRPKTVQIGRIRIYLQNMLKLAWFTSSSPLLSASLNWKSSRTILTDSVESPASVEEL